MRKVALVLLVFVAAGVACDDDEAPTAPAQQVYFALGFSKYRNYFDYDQYVNYIHVHFATTDMSVVPEVKVNNELMESFWVGDGGGLAGHMDLPLTSSVSYSVSAKGKTTSGTMLLPADVTNVRCNGVNLSESSTTTLLPASSLAFTWAQTDCDYFPYYFYGWSGSCEESEGTTTTPAVTFSAGSCTQFAFGVVSTNGAEIAPGHSPNVSGDYGKGYVMARSESKYYDIELTSSGVTVTPSERPPKKDGCEPLGKLLKAAVEAL